MALENAQFPTQLVPANPQGGDIEGQGDDHIRVIKRVLKDTFPGLTGPVTVTSAQLNVLSDPTKLIYPGMVGYWSGALTNIPAGWKLCNGVGTTSNGIAVPDLRDRFVIGAGGTNPVGSTQGSTTHSQSSSVSVAGHVLTLAQIPNHGGHTAQYAHTLVEASRRGSNWLTSRTRGAQQGPSSSGLTGGNQAHAHGATLTLGGANHLPPYHALAFIIKD